LRSIDPHVRFDTGTFPIGVGDGIDAAGEGHPDPEMLGDPMAAHRMGAAPGGFLHDRSALQHFQIVGELFPAGKSVLGGEYEGRFAVQAFAENIRVAPVLLGDVALTRPQVVQMGALRKEIG